MLRFLFGKKDEASVETQRQAVKRCIQELNEILAGLEGAKLSVKLDSGTLAVELPEQMPDEAKALPAPKTAETVAAASSKAETKDGNSKSASNPPQPAAATPATATTNVAKPEKVGA